MGHLWGSRKGQVVRRLGMSFGLLMRALGALLLCLVVSACGAGGYGAPMKSAEMAYDSEAGSVAESPMAPEMEYDAGGDGGEREYKSAPPPLGAKTDLDGAPSDEAPHISAGTDEPKRRAPILIYEANLGIAVFQVQDNLDKIEKTAVEKGGYLVTRFESGIKVRVPAEKFEETVDEFLKLGDVISHQVTTKDVTAEYTDLEIRIKNAVVVRQRLEELLTRTQNVEEALKVEKELRRLTDELEVMKGRIKLLKELSSYSTITVHFSERTSQIRSRVALPFPWLRELGLHRLLDL